METKFIKYCAEFTINNTAKQKPFANSIYLPSSEPLLVVLKGIMPKEKEKIWNTGKIKKYY